MVGTIDGRKTNLGRSDSQKANPFAIERYLKGIHYPAQKQDLLDQAENNGAPQDIMNALNHFTDKEYKNVIDIAREINLS